MKRFITLEGLHGVGKSTVAELVAGHLGIKVTPTIPEVFAQARKHVNDGESIEARFMLFLSATLSAGELIKQMLAEGQNVIVESYIYRTIAFHEGMGSLITMQIPDRLFQPTHSILLVCDPLNRARRLEERGGLRNRWDAFAETHSDEIMARYLAFNFPIVDTTNLKAEQVASKVLEMIE
ncbi:MAG: AAA family ATPase [Patescibacteria group bacterium]